MAGVNAATSTTATTTAPAATAAAPAVAAPAATPAPAVETKKKTDEPTFIQKHGVLQFGADIGSAATKYTTLVPNTEIPAPVEWSSEPLADSRPKEADFFVRVGGKGDVGKDKKVRLTVASGIYINPQWVRSDNVHSGGETFSDGTENPALEKNSASFTRYGITTEGSVSWALKDIKALGIKEEDSKGNETFLGQQRFGITAEYRGGWMGIDNAVGDLSIGSDVDLEADVFRAPGAGQFRVGGFVSLLSFGLYANAPLNPASDTQLAEHTQDIDLDGNGDVDHKQMNASFLIDDSIPGFIDQKGGNWQLGAYAGLTFRY